MIAKAALAAALLAAVAAGVMAWLWQGARGEAALLRADKAALEEQAARSERAREIAALWAVDLHARLQTYEAALAALQSEDISDEALGPDIVAALCSLSPDDPVCRDADPGGAAARGP